MTNALTKQHFGYLLPSFPPLRVLRSATWSGKFSSFRGLPDAPEKLYEMNIYVGNLPHATADPELREAFEEYGAVDSATIIKDRFTGKSRGFGFVEMPDSGEAQAAIDGLNGQDFGGRTITVNEARPREDRGRGGGGGGGNRGGGGYGGGGGNRGGGGGGGYGGGGGGGRRY